MWNEVIGLLDIRFATDEEFDEHVAELVDLNDWLRRQYGPKGMTCEEVCKAYNLLVEGELGMEVFARLAPKYVGSVLKAYRDYLNDNVEYSSVNRQQLLLYPATEPTADQIKARMNALLMQATAIAKTTGDFADPGNSLYTWLEQSGLINPTAEEQAEYMKRAESIVRQLLAEEKAAIPRINATPGQNAKREELTETLKMVLGDSDLIPASYIDRVRAQAKYLYLNDYLKTLP
ncbi:hypothetical protein [Fibrisoma limi]|nr:hypothetical protein [Fibrisoma limi]